MRVVLSRAKNKMSCLPKPKKSGRATDYHRQCGGDHEWEGERGMKSIRLCIIDTTLQVAKYAVNWMHKYA